MIWAMNPHPKSNSTIENTWKEKEKEQNSL